jgi:hypothetical protein
MLHSVEIIRGIAVSFSAPFAVHSVMLFQEMPME